MSYEYKYFKMALEAIDPGCLSLIGYDDFLPVRSSEDICSHFKNEEQLIVKALGYLDDIANCEISPALLAGADLEVIANVKRLVAESSKVDREDFIALLKEDWAARHVSCEA